MRVHLPTVRADVTPPLDVEFYMHQIGCGESHVFTCKDGDQGADAWIVSYDPQSAELIAGQRGKLNPHFGL